MCLHGFKATFIRIRKSKDITNKIKISIDGGKLMNLVLSTIVAVQMGSPVGVFGVRSQTAVAM